MKLAVQTLAVVVCLVSIHSCSVQSGPLPVGVESQEPEMVALGRTEIKDILTGLSVSAQAVNRIQSVLKRGLEAREETPESAGARSLTLSGQNLLEPTNGDSMTFDADRPERFEYRLNNSTSLNLKTKSGGKITMTLSGSLIELTPEDAIESAMPS
ncbi:MAG: hypothetical protein NTV34_01570 [Proteobacteria bacterium]|nr:hypothetical protein [Pseudomonadota bacterium]